MEDGNTTKATWRWKRWPILMGAVVVAVVGVVASWPGPKEPAYQSKKLSQWLALYLQDSRQRIQTIDFTPEAINTNADVCRLAIRQIGTNGLPYLVDWLHYERPRWRSVLADLYLKLPSRARRRTVADRIAGPDPLSQMRGAYWGFWALGPDAAPAIPALVNLSYDRNRAVSLAAIDCLGFIGPSATIYLERLTNGLDASAYWKVHSAIFSSKSWSIDPATGKRTLVRKD